MREVLFLWSMVSLVGRCVMFRGAVEGRGGDGRGGRGGEGRGGEGGEGRGGEGR